MLVRALGPVPTERRFVDDDLVGGGLFLDGAVALSPEGSGCVTDRDTEKPCWWVGHPIELTGSELSPVPRHEDVVMEEKR